MPVANIASKWKQDNIRRTNEAFDTGFPFVRICLKIFEGNGSQIAVSPAVGSQFPAIVTETLGDFGSGLTICLKVWIGFPIGLVSPIPQNAIVTGKGDNRSGTFIGKIWVFLDKIF